MPPNEGFLLDTNTFREVTTGNPTVLRYWQATNLPILLSSVAVEEVLTGLMASLNRARSGKFPVSVPQAHASLINIIETLKHFPVLTYSDDAETAFRGLGATAKRVGTQDCRIAAQAMAHRLTVVTRNLQDFERIGVLCVDWTVQ